MVGGRRGGAELDSNFGLLNDGANSMIGRSTSENRSIGRSTSASGSTGRCAAVGEPSSAAMVFI